MDDDSFLIEERANQRNLYKIKLEKKTKSIDEKWDSGAVRYKSKIVSPFHFFFFHLVTTPNNMIFHRGIDLFIDWSLVDKFPNLLEIFWHLWWCIGLFIHCTLFGVFSFMAFLFLIAFVLGGIRLIPFQRNLVSISSKFLKRH